MLSAAEANQKAEEERLARVKLEATLAPRLLSEPQQHKFIELMQSFPGVIADVWLCNSPTADAAPLSETILWLLNAAKWSARGVSRLLGFSEVGVIIVIRENASASDKQAADTLVEELNSENILARIETGVTDSPVSVIGAFVGNGGEQPPSNIWIIVGSKP